MGIPDPDDPGEVVLSDRSFEIADPPIVQLTEVFRIQLFPEFGGQVGRIARREAVEHGLQFFVHRFFLRACVGLRYRQETIPGFRGNTHTNMGARKEAVAVTTIQNAVAVRDNPRRQKQLRWKHDGKNDQ